VRNLKCVHVEWQEIRRTNFHFVIQWKHIGWRGNDCSWLLVFILKLRVALEILASCDAVVVRGHLVFTFSDHYGPRNHRHSFQTVLASWKFTWSPFYRQSCLKIVITRKYWSSVWTSQSIGNPFRLWIDTNSRFILKQPRLIRVISRTGRIVNCQMQLSELLSGLPVFLGQAWLDPHLLVHGERTWLIGGPLLIRLKYFYISIRRNVLLEDHFQFLFKQFQ